MDNLDPGVDRLDGIFASLSSELLEKQLESLLIRHAVEEGLPEDGVRPNEMRGLVLQARAKSIVPLSRLAEQQLFEIFKKGDPKERIDALEQLIGTSFELIENGATYCLRFGGEFEDLIQAGIEGVMKAAADYDSNMGNRFATYAKWWVRSYQMRSLDDTSRIIRVPSHASEKYWRYLKIHRNSFGENEPVDVVPELCEQVESKPWMIEAVQNASEKIVSLSIREIREEASELTNDYDPYIEIEDSELGTWLETILDSLSERESGVIRMRYGLSDGIPNTLDEIGETFGVTRERVRQIESKAMMKLRHPSRSMPLRAFVGLDEDLQSGKPLNWFQ